MQYDFFDRIGEMHFTPPVQVLYALQQAIREYWEEGEQARFDRLTQCWEAIHQGLDEIGIDTTEVLQGLLDRTAVRVADVNGDGRNDLLTLRGGRVVAKSPLGELLWDTPPLEASSIIGVVDLNPAGVDDVPEVIVVKSSVPAAVYILDAATGAINIDATPPTAILSTLDSERVIISDTITLSGRIGSCTTLSGTGATSSDIWGSPYRGSSTATCFSTCDTSGW